MCRKHVQDHGRSQIPAVPFSDRLGYFIVASVICCFVETISANLGFKVIKVDMLQFGEDTASLIALT